RNVHDNVIIKWSSKMFKWWAVCRSISSASTALESMATGIPKSKQRQRLQIGERIDPRLIELVGHEREEKKASSLRQPDNLRKFKWKSSP
ncbi:hypothetical protein ACLOJK_036798, partial [Asimina triloba]